MSTKIITEGPSFRYDIRELDGRLLRMRVSEDTEGNERAVVLIGRDETTGETFVLDLSLGVAEENPVGVLPRLGA